jgi:hypothetical protein
VHHGALIFSHRPCERLAERWRTFEAPGFASARIADDLADPGHAGLESLAAAGLTGFYPQRHPGAGA